MTTSAELDVPRLGRIHVPRSHLLRIDRWRNGADVIYDGPDGLAGWHDLRGRKEWGEDLGRPVTHRDGASIRRNVGLPARASIEFEISWKTKPDFTFALGVDDQADAVKWAFRFEVWGGDFVVQRELEHVADLAIVQEVSAGPGRAHMQAYLDQEKGRIVVFSPGGDQVADLLVSEKKPVVRPGLCLENTRGDVRLDWLRIAPWDGESPRAVHAGRAHIRRGDGSVLDGHLTGLDAASREFVLKTEKGESRVPLAQVSSVSLSVPKGKAFRMIRAVYEDGTRVSGDLVRLEEGMLVLAVPGIADPARLPLAGLRSVAVLRHKTAGGRAGGGKSP